MASILKQGCSSKNVTKGLCCMRHTWVTPLTKPALYLQYENNMLAPIVYVKVTKKGQSHSGGKGR